MATKPSYPVKGVGGCETLNPKRVSGCETPPTWPRAAWPRATVRRHGPHHKILFKPFELEIAIKAHRRSRLECPGHPYPRWIVTPRLRMQWGNAKASC